MLNHSEGLHLRHFEGVISDQQTLFFLKNLPLVRTPPRTFPPKTLRGKDMECLRENQFKLTVMLPAWQ